MLVDFVENVFENDFLFHRIFSSMLFDLFINWQFNEWIQSNNKYRTNWIIRSDVSTY